jgi:NADH-quinone oxidoreductase subunit J
VFLRQLAFWVFAGFTGLASLFVVTTRNVVHSALGLAAALVGAAALFILFGAEFIGLAQILIYVGAVVVLFLFGIMLTSSSSTGRPVIDNKQRGMAALVALGVFGVLAAGIVTAFRGQTLDFKVAFPIRELGNELFTRWILPFEAVSILLLAALVGAIVLARRD